LSGAKLPRGRILEGAWVMLRVRIVVTAILVTLVPGPAGAGFSAGACVTHVSLTFESRLNLTTQATGVTALSGDGAPCGPTGNALDLPDSLITDMEINGSGFADPASCELILASGSYVMSFGATYLTSSGDWTYAGTIAGGVLVLVDQESPNLVGVATLMLDPLDGAQTTRLTNCASVTPGTGSKKAVLAGALTFVDP